MNQNKQIETNDKGTSRLERFTLSFEYDKTIQQVKRETRMRTL